MSKYFLRTQMKTENLAVPVEFIDSYMPSASGEAVKVYLCLLRASQDPSQEMSAEEMEDRFDLTEKKLMQCLAYWEEKGLLRLERRSGEIAGLELLKIGGADEGGEPEEEEPRFPQESLKIRSVTREEMEAPVRQEAVREETPADRPINVHDLDEDDAFSELLGLAEFYLRRPLTSTQRESLGFSYLLFDRQSDVIEYLLEYCIEQGHQSFRYIESVARGWHQEGLRTLPEIRAAAAERNRAASGVKKAFGITNRNLVRDETALLEKWTKKFDMELILEACRRTMAAIHSPSFPYADSILRAWEEKGVGSLADIEAVDRERKTKLLKKEDGKTAKAGNTFRNFDERKTDYSALIQNYYEG